MRRETNEHCPSEERCEEGGRIFMERRRFRNDALPILTICNGCPLLPTKTSEQPQDLAHWSSVALRLERLKEAGAVYAYPDALTPAEWAALDALKLGRLEADDEAAKEKASQQAEQATVTRLQAAQNRR